jgi:hypothetical protein
MRNLKKLLAVIMAVAMLASIMVPALAADYDDDAQKLYNLGLFKGSSGSSYQPDLDGTLTREQGLTLMIRAMGKDEEALGMSEAEINEQLAKVEDAADITDWAKPYVAYAVKNGLTKGIGGATPPNIKFGAQLDLSGKEFINFMLYAMGYTDAWDIVLDKAVEIGMLTAGEAVKFGSMDVIIRDVAIGIMAGSMGGTTAAGITLAQALVEAGVVTEEAMVEAGYMDPIVTPTPEPIVLTATASADNLIQIYVVYSQEVDEKSAEDLDNYEIEDVDIADAELQDDGVTVVLTLADDQDQQTKVDLVINKVKDTAGTVIATDYTIEDIELLDMTIPAILEASVVGNDTIKVVFSEPMESSSLENKANYEVKSNKTLYVKKATAQKNDTEVLVEMYSKLPEGEISFKVKSDVEDYAGFGVVADAMTLAVVKDEEKPVVIGYENADQDEVTLIWSEDIEIKDGDKANFYHTNYKNTIDADLTAADIDGNKMTLKFSDKQLPEGTAYVYVLKESVNDLWDNKNDQQMIQIEVEVDEIPPEVDELKVTAEDEIEITFTEDLDAETAEDEDNYVILDDEGEEVEDIISDISLSGKKVTISFVDKLSGDYSIVISDVEDKAGNEIGEVTVPFTVGDKTPPDHTKFKATIYKPSAKGQLLKVDFGDKMATEGKYSVLDVEKYVINGTNLEKIKGVEIEITDDGKSVEITIPSSADVDESKADNHLNVEAGDKLVIARVADAAGNKMGPLYTDEKTIGVSETIGIDYARATAIDTVKVRFEGNLDKFEVEDLIITTGDEPDDEEVGIGSVEVGLDDGKTLVTFTLSEDLDLEYGNGAPTYYVHVIGEESEDVYGAKIKLDDKEEIADKIAPTVAKDVYDEDKLDIVFADGVTDSTITITFTEDMKTAADGANYEHYKFDLIIKDNDGDALTAGDYTITVSGKQLIITILGVSDIEDYSIQSVDSVTYIKDAKDNKMAKFGRVRN